MQWQCGDSQAEALTTVKNHIAPSVAVKDTNNNLSNKDE